jgi:mRNA interferase MazF
MLGGPRRGEVWWSELPEIGRRPVVVLSRDVAIPRLRRALVAPCTTTSISVAVLVERLGVLSSDKMRAVCTRPRSGRRWWTVMRDEAAYLGSRAPRRAARRLQRRYRRPTRAAGLDPDLRPNLGTGRVIAPSSGAEVSLVPRYGMGSRQKAETVGRPSGPLRPYAPGSGTIPICSSIESNPWSDQCSTAVPSRNRPMLTATVSNALPCLACARESPPSSTDSPSTPNIIETGTESYRLRTTRAAKTKARNAG